MGVNNRKKLGVRLKLPLIFAAFEGRINVYGGGDRA